MEPKIITNRKSKRISVEEDKKQRDKNNLERVKHYCGFPSAFMEDYVKKGKYYAGRVPFDNSKLLDCQKQTLQDYYKYYTGLVKKKKVNTLLIVFRNLAYFAVYIKRDFNKVQKNDVQEYISYLREIGRAEGDINLKLSRIKTFYKWLYQMEDGYPEVVKWIKTTIMLKDRKMNELLTPLDVKKMVDVCYKPRDKCLLAVLYEGGLRIDELLSLTFEGVNEDRGFYKITVAGKTGTRTVQLLYSSTYLKEWINSHPFRAESVENPSIPVFISLLRGYGNKLTYSAANFILKKAVSRANIHKRVHFHLFRHSRGTELHMKGFNDKDLRVFLGHSRNSPMPSVYSHYGETEVSKKLKTMYGLEDKEDLELEKAKYEALKPIKCKKCKSANPSTNLFCSVCNNPLNEKAVKKQAGAKMMEEMLDDDDFIDLLKEYRKKKKLKGL